MLTHIRSCKVLCFCKAMLVIVALQGSANASAQGNSFVSIELFEMGFNNFKNFAGEIGYRFNDKYQTRFTIMDVVLTERHLSSDTEAYAIDGDNVEGVLRGYELNVDRYFTKSFYVSLNVGHYTDIYKHTIIPDQVLSNRTFTVGTGIGYLKRNPLGVKNAYVNLNMPFRYYFNSIDETKLGETTVREHLIVNHLWLFLGFHF